MFSQKSLRVKFVIQLASASAMLILIFSVMLYRYIKITVFETSSQTLLIEASRIAKSTQNGVDIYQNSNNNSEFTIKIEPNSDGIKKPKYIKEQLDERSFLTLKYPLEDNSKILSLKTETTIYTNIVKQILADIIIMNVTMIFLILFYAMLLSRTLLIPIKTLSNKLASLNEKVLLNIDEKNIELEFRPLAIGINRLIDRIKTFIMYQKELFIGIAHELKTPLAVMKTKNEVTLLKRRDTQKYIEALEKNIETIDEMNKAITSILKVGRQESAQFEKAIKKEMISYIEELVQNFAILAKNEDKFIITKLSPSKIYLTIQPTLFLHIIQNFVQNAIKFSPKGSSITIKSYIKNSEFIIEVLDEGCGLKENIDIYAPFKKDLGSGGVGLGLFLAKGAAQAMNATILVENREVKGVVATLKLPISKNKKKDNI